MEDVLSWSRKVEDVQGLAVLVLEANLDPEAETGPDPNPDPDQNLLVDQDHLLLEGLVQDPDRLTVGGQDPGLANVVQGLWTEKTEHRTKGQLLVVEVALQKGADHDLHLKTERKEMEISRITMLTKIDQKHLHRTFVVPKLRIIMSWKHLSFSNYELTNVQYFFFT